MREPDLQIVPVDPEAWSRLRDIRLAALEESPEMFGSTLARERAFDEAEWRRRAARPVTFLAARDGRDVGLAGVHQFDWGWTVVAMWIAPGARGTGVVDALMEVCREVAHQAGAETLVLGVMEDNTAGIRAYRRLGFAPNGRRDLVRDGRHEMWLSATLNADRPRPPAR